MNTTTTCCDRAPLPTTFIAHLWHQLANGWSRHLQASRELHETEAMSELNADTLRDIGAPERWVERAVQRRETEEIKLQELRQWRNG